MAHEEININESVAEEGGKPRSKLLAELTEEEEEEEESKMKSRSREEEIMKELNNIKRQNSITHYLLTASILVTLAWQLSEFSLIFKIRQGFNSPLTTIGGAIKRLFYNEQDAHQQMQQVIIPSTHLPGLKIPDLPHLDFTPATSSNDDDDN